MITVATKVLFLDFDGVLHPDGSEAIDERGRLIDNPVLFCWLPILADILDPYPAVRIIVSSDWRRLFDDAALIRLLGPLGTRFAGVVERITPPRAQEILHDALQRGLSDWIALDDHKSVQAAARTDPRFIACAPATGITDEAVQLAVRAWLEKK